MNHHPYRFRAGVASVLLSAGVLIVSGCGEPRSAHGPTAKPGPLSGKSVAILITDGVEKAELLEPCKALEEAGATTVIVSPEQIAVKLWSAGDWDGSVAVDTGLGNAKADAYDALLLPGGVMNPDKLRIDPAAVAFAHAFVTAGKPIAAICHGPWLLIEAGGVKGLRMTSWPSLHSDLTNAGATWVDEPVVADRKLVTSRKPDDIPAFDAQMIVLFAGKSP